MDRQIGAIKICTTDQTINILNDCVYKSVGHQQRDNHFEIEITAT